MFFKMGVGIFEGICGTVILKYKISIIHPIYTEAVT